jgi:RNA polymerase-binding transcription factor DksA
LESITQTDWIAVPEGIDANEPDTDLVADAVEEWGERQALVATLERRYNDVTRALSKREVGTFGTCEVCMEHIEDDRLDANPSARTCKTHMNEEESLSV